MNYNFIPFRCMLFPVAFVSSMIKMERLYFLGLGMENESRGVSTFNQDLPSSVDFTHMARSQWHRQSDL